MVQNHRARILKGPATVSLSKTIKQLLKPLPRCYGERRASICMRDLTSAAILWIDAKDHSCEYLAYETSIGLHSLSPLD